MDKINVAILVSTLNKGGAERVAANMSIEFSKHYNVYLIVHDARDITYPYNGNLIDLQLPPVEGVLNKVVNIIRRVYRVRKIKKKYNIQYSISHLPMCNYVNVLSRRKDKIYTYIHSMEKKKRSVYLREKFVTYFSDYRICVSECVKKNMIENFNINEKKLRTVYNFYDFKENNNEYRCLKNGKIIVCMGRFAKEKGQWHLIRAMKRVVEDMPDIQLIMLGDGELRGEYEKLIEMLDLNRNVTLLGYVSEPNKILETASIFVSPSEVEGLPMALIEAGACKVPIISTDCDAGCREILAPSTPVDAKTKTIEYAEYGVLIPVCNDFDYKRLECSDRECVMADAIIDLLRSKEKLEEYSKKSYRRALQFRPENVIKEWNKLIF